MINTCNVQLRFNATDEIKKLVSARSGVKDWTDGVTQIVKEDMAEGLIAAFPGCFTIVTDDKQAPGPTHNKAMPAPPENKKTVLDVQRIFDAARSANLIEKNGPWYSFGKIKLGRGKATAIEFLTSNKTLAAKIEGML